MKIQIEITCNSSSLSYEQIKKMTAKAAKEINEQMKSFIEDEIDFEFLSGKSEIRPKGKFPAEDQIVPFQYFLQVY
jgi:hypothetical protein